MVGAIMADFFTMTDILPAEYVPLVSAFLLVFAIIFGLLEITKVFGEKGTNINILISVVIAIFAASDPTIVGYMQIGLPYVLGIMALLFIYVMWSKIQEQRNKSRVAAIAAAGGKTDEVGENHHLYMIIAAMALLIIGSSWGTISQYLPANLRTQDIQWIIGIIIFLFMIYTGAQLYFHEEKEKRKYRQSQPQQQG